MNKIQKYFQFSGTINGTNFSTFGTDVGADHGAQIDDYRNDRIVRITNGTAANRGGYPLVFWGNSTKLQGFYGTSDFDVFDAPSSPDETALRFRIVGPTGGTFKVNCVQPMFRLPTTSGLDMTVRLYDSSTTELDAVNIDHDNNNELVSFTNFQEWCFNTATQPSLSFNTWYRIGFKPNGVNGGSGFRWMNPTALQKTALVGGTNVMRSSRTGTGAWTDFPNHHPVMRVRINEISLTAGGGGRTQQTNLLSGGL